MKYRLPFALLALCLVFFWGSSTATVRVTDISLQKNSQFTEVTLTCDGAAEFVHQIVEATANKPYRIVIDVKDAIPGLDQLSFKNLPSGSIKQIRTSQFAIDPEKIVRVVLDVAGALTYKVKGNGNTFTLQINTPTDKDFPTWSAAEGRVTSTFTLAETAKKTEPQPATSAVAKGDSPKSMPAHPDKPATPTQAVTDENNSREAKLAAKPIDESKLLTKVSKPTPVAKEEEVSSPIEASSSPHAKKESKPADEKAEPAKSTAKQSVTPAATAPTTTETSAGKRSDSAALQQAKPTQSQPEATPAEQAKPPKAQKTALPETKVTKSPPYTQEPEAGNALTGEIATAAGGTKPATAAVKPEGAMDSGQSTALSKSEEVRQRYIAGRDKGTAPAEASTESMGAVDTSVPQTPLTEIEKIRLKYKRGIRFVQNDMDERQQAASEPEEYEEGELQQSGVGAYNEFLPEREIVVYQSSGRPDPFLPLLEEAAASAKGGELPDVETLRLVGILQDRKVSRALFEDYNGYSYILRTGERVKNGFVLAIEDTRVLFQIRQYGWNRQVAIDLENEK